MRKRTKVLLACAVVAVVALLCLGVIFTRDRLPPLAGDADGDGRYQVAKWKDPDAEGAPTVLTVFVGAGGNDHDEIRVSIAVPGEGLIGSFAASAPDLLDAAAALLTGARPMIVWNLSNYPPGTEFTITTTYVNAKSAVIDTETTRTTRPETATPNSRP